GHALAALRAAAAAVAGQRADAARRAVVFLDAVTGRQARETVPFHRAGRATALRRADHVHRGHVLENLADRQELADRVLARSVEAELADVPLRLAVGLGHRRDAGLGTRLAALRFEVGRDVAALRPGRVAPLLVLKAEL